jgi:ABC-type antimicrobial peptide transport system permease subunit
VRLALGAQAPALLRMVLREGVVLAGLGVAFGVLGALWLTSFIEKLLFGVKRLDAPTFLGVAAVLTAVSLIACLGPAWRATRSDIVRVLKAE